MSNESITIHLPEEMCRKVERPGCGLETVEQWLGGEGIPLNTRCGGRGYCRGCRVILEEPGGVEGREIRSCQVPVSELADEIVGIRIPQASLRDRTLHGVSAFEIRLEENAEFVPRAGYGLALDIGTTTLAAALWDFRTGECLATASGTNVQVRFGDNVLTRISFSLENSEGMQLLRNALIHDSIPGLLRELKKKSGISAESITEAVARDCRSAAFPPQMPDPQQSPLPIPDSHPKAGFRHWFQSR